MLVEGPKSASNKIDVSDEVDEVTQSAREVPGKRVGTARMGSSTFAMENRDPNQLNPHVQIMWDDIIGEPEGLRTPDACWNCSNKCYECTRRGCYVLLTVIFAPFIAFFAGCEFACLAFSQVWCVGPCLRLWKINCATFKKFWTGLIMALCGPCAEITGLYFSKIKVRYQKVPDGDDRHVDDEYFNV